MSEEKYEYEYEPELEDECLLENDYLEYDGQHNNPHINDDACAQGAIGERKGYQPVSQSKGVSEDPVIPPPKKP